MKAELSDMELQNSALKASLEDLRHSSAYEDSALRENITTEENVCEYRQIHFENFSCSTDIGDALDSYFGVSIQGLDRGHLPSTFDLALNAPAILPETIERNNKIVRLERIDRLFTNDNSLTYEKLIEAVSLGRGGAYTLEQLLREFESFAGERPAFACFKHEIEDDLKAADWLIRIINRLGLIHSIPMVPGQIYSFALMEYTVKEVFEQAATKGISRPMAVATVLECQRNPAFYPAPSGSSWGFTVDLSEPPSGRSSVREILNIRLDYRKEHVLRFGQLTGPCSGPDLAICRQRHAAGLTARTPLLGSDRAPDGDAGR